MLLIRQKTTPCLFLWFYYSSCETTPPPSRIDVGPHQINCVYGTGPLHAEYLGCDALHPNVLDCRTGWNRSVLINQSMISVFEWTSCPHTTLINCTLPKG